MGVVSTETTTDWQEGQDLSQSCISKNFRIKEYFTKGPGWYGLSITWIVLWEKSNLKDSSIIIQYKRKKLHRLMREQKGEGRRDEVKTCPRVTGPRTCGSKCLRSVTDSRRYRKRHGSRKRSSTTRSSRRDSGRRSPLTCFRTRSSTNRRWNTRTTTRKRIFCLKNVRGRGRSSFSV